LDGEENCVISPTALAPQIAQELEARAWFLTLPTQMAFPIAMYILSASAAMFFQVNPVLHIPSMTIHELFLQTSLQRLGPERRRGLQMATGI
jgi:hypothetical protein